MVKVSLVVCGTGGSTRGGISEGAYTKQYLLRNLPRLRSFAAADGVRVEIRPCLFDISFRIHVAHFIVYYFFSHERTCVPSTDRLRKPLEAARAYYCG